MKQKTVQDFGGVSGDVVWMWTSPPKAQSPVNGAIGRGWELQEEGLSAMTWVLGAVPSRRAACCGSFSPFSAPLRMYLHQILS